MNSFRFALRQLLKKPGFTAAAVFTLALGVGANTAVFSVIHRVLWQAPPWKDPNRVVMLWESAPKQGYDKNHAGTATFLDWKAQSRSFESMGAFAMGRELHLTGDGDPETLATVPVTANLFDVLGISPVQGRPFLAEEGTPGNDQVAIISHALWLRRYQADPGVIGQTMRLDGQTRVIVGVMPPGFVYPGRTGVLYGFFHNHPADLWIPLAWPAERWLERSNHELQVAGRLKPGVPIAQAKAEMDGLMGRIFEANPGETMGTHVTLIPLHEQSVAHVRGGLFLLLGASALVLLIAWANLVNLFLVRAAGRRLEFGIRMALGARRRQILGPMLSESVLLALLGGALGMLLAHGGVVLLGRWAGDILAQSTPGWGEFRSGLGVLAFTLILSLAVGVASGLAASWHASQAPVAGVVQGGTRGSPEGAPRHRMRRALVAAQTAVAVTLVIGAGLVLRSFLKLQGIDSGFDPRQVFTFVLSLPESSYSNEVQRAAFVQSLERRLRDIPGAGAVGTTSQLPLSGDLGNITFAIEGRPPAPLDRQPDADLVGATPGYTHALGIPLAAGRLLEDRDNASAPSVCLINQTLARRHFAGQNPVGQKLRLRQDDRAREIVGVIQDIQQRRLDSDALAPEVQALLGSQIYLPYAQVPAWLRLTFVIKSPSSSAGLEAAVRAEVRMLDARLPISRVRWMETVRGNSIAQPRLRTWLLGVFGGLALVLAALGVYGVLAFAVACRTHEMGVRMALGARRFDVLALVVRQGMRAVWIGLALGLAGAFALTRLLASLLYRTSPTDLASFGTVAAVVALTALGACCLPALRASRIQPMEALRYE